MKSYFTVKVVPSPSQAEDGGKTPQKQRVTVSTQDVWMIGMWK
jgi:hypothetical protein